MLNNKIKYAVVSMIFIMPLSLIASGYNQSLPQNNIQSDVSQAQNSMQSMKTPSNKIQTNIPSQKVGVSGQQSLTGITGQKKSEYSQVQTNASQQPNEVSQVKQKVQNVTDSSNNMPSSQNLGQKVKSLGQSSTSSAGNGQTNKVDFYDPSSN